MCVCVCEVTRGWGFVDGNARDAAIREGHGLILEWKASVAPSTLGHSTGFDGVQGVWELVGWVQKCTVLWVCECACLSVSICVCVPVSVVLPFALRLDNVFENCLASTQTNTHAPAV